MGGFQTLSEKAVLHDKLQLKNFCFFSVFPIFYTKNFALGFWSGTK